MTTPTHHSPPAEALESRGAIISNEQDKEYSSSNIHSEYVIGITDDGSEVTKEEAEAMPPVESIPNNFYSCRYCEGLCSTDQWSEPHTDEYCFESIKELIESGTLRRVSEDYDKTSYSSIERLLGPVAAPEEIERRKQAARKFLEQCSPQSVGSDKEQTTLTPNGPQLSSRPSI